MSIPPTQFPAFDSLMVFAVCLLGRFFCICDPQTHWKNWRQILWIYHGYSVNWVKWLSYIQQAT